MTHPNIIFLSVDAMRFDHTGLGDYARPTTPTLNRMRDNAVFCPNAFSLAPFTQSACIQMLTSTRPFSFGGYDHGAWGRPDTLFKQFQTAGYDTTAVSTIHWVNQFMGYGDGLNEECQLFVINSLVGVCIGNIRNTLSLYYQGRLSEKELLAKAAPIIRKFFDNVEKYCRLRIVDRDEYRKRYPNSLIVNIRYNYLSVIKVIKKHQIEFENNSIDYIHKRLNVIPETHSWIASDWKYCRELGKLFSEAFFQASNALLAIFDPKTALNRSARFKPYVEAYEVANKIIDKISIKSSEKPFFIWAHFMDTHLPYTSGHGRKWYKETRNILDHLGHSRDINPSASRDARPNNPEEWEAYKALYDASIYTVDSQIARILYQVEQVGIADDTIIAVCSDHGEEFGEHDNFAHQFTFYEHNVRVPLLFYRPGLGRRVEESLMTLMDIGPTLADMAGIEACSEWCGKPLGSVEVVERDHVLMETFFGGNCLFDLRPFYFGVRTKTHKYIWKSGLDERDSYSPEGPELYDLIDDPEEQVNIYSDDHPLIPALNRIIAKRMMEISEIPLQRIIDAFGLDASGALK